MARVSGRALLLAGLYLLAVAGIAQPAPTDERNGLSAAAAATLWSRDEDRAGALPAEVGETAAARARALATVTDLTFAHPPDTARRWTERDFEDLEAGGAETSLAPEHATLTDGRLLRDAHVTLFAVTPATIAHRSPDCTTRYVAPDGTVRALVDYRVASEPADGAQQYEIRAHRVERISLFADGRELATRHHRQGGRVVLPYRLDADVECLRLEATISVRAAPVETNESEPGAPDSRCFLERRTVTDSVPVTRYAPDGRLVIGKAPQGHSRMAVALDQPWQTLTAPSEDGPLVRGVWRFYTARDPRWDRLVRHGGRGPSTHRSPARPVAVHAFPARPAREATPGRLGARIADSWGPTRRSPVGALPDSVTVGVTTERYRSPAALELAVPGRSSPATVGVRGILSGANQTLQPATTLHLRPTSLQTSWDDASERPRRLRVTVEDARTGEPIETGGRPVRGFDDRPDRARHVVDVDGREHALDQDGGVTVSVASPSPATVRYRPASWTRTPAYEPTKTTVYPPAERRHHRWRALALVALGVVVIAILIGQLARHSDRFVRGPQR